MMEIELGSGWIFNKHCKVIGSDFYDLVNLKCFISMLMSIVYYFGSCFSRTLQVMLILSHTSGTLFMNHKIDLGDASL